MSQGWKQLTDHGKIYISKKEKNVFILEGTRAAGFSACAFCGNEEDLGLVEGGRYTLTSELKCVPGEQCTEKQVFLVFDCHDIADLSSCCDFVGVHANFDTHELRVENHRLNAATQTLFAQPNCVPLRTHAYAALSVAMDAGVLALSLNGISLISSLPVARPRLPKPGTAAPGVPHIGIAVYGKTRCYMRRFRITPLPQAASPAAAPAPAPGNSHAGGGGGRGVAVGHCAAMLGAVAMPGTSSTADEVDLMGMLERDVVVRDLNVRFDDIGGLEDAKRAINESVVLPLLIPEFFTGIRQPWKGVLLFGPPGTGKTMLAKAVASCSEDLTFFNCSAATLTSKWRGESEKLLRALFTSARTRAPSVLFLDEIDSMLSQRGSSAEHEASRRFKSEFLIHMDGLVSATDEDDQSGHLLVLATSNAPWDLDEALRRRFEKRIFVPLPDAATRAEMFKHHLRNLHLGSDIDVAALAARTKHYSGADIQLICRDASLSPVRRVVSGLSPIEVVQLRDEGKLTPGALPTAMTDFELALSGTQPSVSSADTERHMAWARQFGSK